jgi:glycine cleavage system H lipoate-binding protein
VEHTWIKLVSADVVVLGITPSMVLILGDPYNMTLPKVGLELVRDRDVFSNIGGWKISADLYSPVSGKIVGVNMGLKPYLISDKILPIVDSAYVHGWIVAVQLSKPEELDELLDSQEYLERLGKK